MAKLFGVAMVVGSWGWIDMTLLSVPFENNDSGRKPSRVAKDMLAATTEKVEISERFLVTMRHGEAAEVPNDQSLLPGKKPRGTVLVEPKIGVPILPLKWRVKIMV